MPSPADVLGSPYGTALGIGLSIARFSTKHTWTPFCGPLGCKDIGPIFSPTPRTARTGRPSSADKLPRPEDFQPGPRTGPAEAARADRRTNEQRITEELGNQGVWPYALWATNIDKKTKIIRAISEMAMAQALGRFKGGPGAQPKPAKPALVLVPESVRQAPRILGTFKPELTSVRRQMPATAAAPGETWDILSAKPKALRPVPASKPPAKPPPEFVVFPGPAVPHLGVQLDDIDEVRVTSDKVGTRAAGRELTAAELADPGLGSGIATEFAPGSAANPARNAKPAGAVWSVSAPAGASSIASLLSPQRLLRIAAQEGLGALARRARSALGSISNPIIGSIRDAGAAPGLGLGLNLDAAAEPAYDYDYDKCNCKKPKKREPRPPRSVCYRGTYRQLGKGISYKKLEQIPCT